MQWFYQYLNFYPMPLWLAMMFAPRHPLTERAGRSSTIFGLAAFHYLVTFVLSMRRMQQNPGTGNLTSLDGVRGILGTREGALAAWAHMLAFDLFVGAWIYRQCRQLDAPGWVRVPALFGALMAGPSGLLYFLLWRIFVGKHGAALPDREA